MENTELFIEYLCNNVSINIHIIHVHTNIQYDLICVMVSYGRLLPNLVSALFTALNWRVWYSNTVQCFVKIMCIYMINIAILASLNISMPTTT